MSGFLHGLRAELDAAERSRFSPWACMSSQAIRVREEIHLQEGHRQNFSVDGDRILHSLSYSRYIDKAQVFYLIKNDHITHRVLHVQLVSKIARTIGRLLHLNEDLIEAIALGHDIGHAPFGHDGEKFLSELCQARDIGTFLHNIQSVRFLQKIERKGRGWNLSLQVLDGIFCHDGELHSEDLEPVRRKDFDVLEEQIRQKSLDPDLDFWPMTLEGCVVRIADTISYVGRDIEDAIRLGIMDRNQIPEECTRVLGTTNGTIVYSLVEDLVAKSLGQPYVQFSPKVGATLKKLKEFNKENIYSDPRIKEETGKIQIMFRLLFEKYCQDLEEGNEKSDIFREYLDGMARKYVTETPPAGIVRDFVAGMTDEYFLSQCRKHFVPQVQYKFYGSVFPPP